MPARSWLTAVRTRLGEPVRRRVRIDARSLAAFRIGLGVLLLADLLLRSRDLVAHYTDAGVMPRAALARFSHPLHFSVHTISGEAWVQAILFVIAGGFALALLLGYRTTTVTVVSWILLISLHNRNPIILNGGDNLLRMLLFWSMFLPLGARWSVDAAQSGARSGDTALSVDVAQSGIQSGDTARSGDGEWSGDTARSRDRSGAETCSHVASVASFALLFQIVLMYTVNAVLKLYGELWLSGEAIRYVFSLDQFTVLLGDVLANHPLLLVAFDRLWLVMVVGSSLLILLTGLRRAGLAVLFMGMHLGMLLTMQLGLFPLIAVNGLLVFLPAQVWDRVLPRMRDSRLGSAAELPRRIGAVLPAVSMTAVPRQLTEVSRWLRRAAERAKPIVVVAFLALILVWHLHMGGMAPMPDRAEDAVHATRTDQYWTMFAPEPMRVDGWYVVPARLENGSRIDAFHGGQVTWDRPPELAATYPNARWRKYLVNLWRDGYGEYRPYFAQYLCERWNSRHEVDIETLTVYYMEQPTRLTGREPINRVKLVDRTCASGG